MADTQPKVFTDTFETSLDKALADNDITEQELSYLRGQIDCTSSDERTKLSVLLEKKISEKKEITEETKVKLRDLLKVCTPQTEKKESTESKSSFEQIFSGTRSEIFSKEYIEVLGGMIDQSFEGISLNPKQKDNIRLAMMDKLLKDPEIQKLFNMQIGVAGILGNILKGDKTEASKVGKANSQMEIIFKTIAERISVATKPLSDFLRKDVSNTTSPLLTNPQEIAKYEGGEISSDIRAMDETELRQYIENLKWSVRTIDNKIFPMEELKEKGMDFLTNAPSFLVDFFKWLLSFDALAKFFGYSGTQQEREWQLDDELKERKSLGILREFGKVTDMEGKQKSGAYSGDIKILEEKDLSKISHKKLDGFFKYCRENGIKYTEKDIWLCVFGTDEKSRTITLPKKEDGTGGENVIFPEITDKDLEKDFEGFYKKLNKLFDDNENRKYKEKQKTQEKASETISTPVPAPVPQAWEKKKKQKPTLQPQPVPKPQEVPRDRRIVLVEAFNWATKIPFSFWSEQVKFENEVLCIGDRKFSFKGCKKLPVGGYTHPFDITDISFRGENLKLNHSFWLSFIPRSDIAKGLPGMLDMKLNAKIEPEGDGGKIIIIRVA